MNGHIYNNFSVKPFYLHIKIEDVDEADISQLLRELESVTGECLATQGNSFLLHYLQDCVYRNGTAQTTPIKKAALDEYDPLNDFFLRKKVKNLTDSAIYQLCSEGAQLSGEGVERHEGKCLYVFINRFFAPFKGSKVIVAGKRIFPL
jgi:hypothetical protein